VFIPRIDMDPENMDPEDFVDVEILGQQDEQVRACIEEFEHLVDELSH